MTKRARTSAVSVAAEVATVLSCSEEACPPVGRSIPPIGLPRGIVRILYLLASIANEVSE